MTRAGDGGTWVKRIFSRPVESPLQEAAPTVPLVIQEWVEARVQTAAEQANAAASVERELQEVRLAAAVEEVAARVSAQSNVAREQQGLHFAAAIEDAEARVSVQSNAAQEMAALISSEVDASLSLARENTEIRVQIATHQATIQAEQGVAALGSALKGVAKVLASLKRDVEIATASNHKNAMAAVASNQEVDAAIHAVETGLISVQNALESKFQGHDAEMAHVVQRVEAVASDHAALDHKQLTLESRIAEQDGRIAAVATDLDSAVSDYTALGNRVAGQDDQIASVAAEIGSAVSDYNAQLRSVEQRVEFVREETMYELQTSIIRASGKNPNDNDQTTARIVNLEKVEKMRATGLRLNIGCGHIQYDDYINVDARELPGVDVVAQAVNMPFTAGEVHEISSAHLVEHFTLHVLDRVLLPYWKSLLIPGGQLTTVAPDGAAMLAAVNDGSMSFEDFRVVLFGAQDYDGDFHYNLITPDSFHDALSRAGFVGIESVYTEKRNGKCFEFRTTARKP